MKHVIFIFTPFLIEAIFLVRDHFKFNRPPYKQVERG